MTVDMDSTFSEYNFDPHFPICVQRQNLDRFELHWHSYIEIIFTLAGSLVITANGNTFNLDAGDFCVLNSGSIHSICHNGQPNDTLLLQVSTSKNSPFFNLGSLRIDHIAYLKDLQERKVPQQVLQQLLLAIYREYQSHNAGYENMVLSFVNMFLGIMIRFHYLIPKEPDDISYSNNLGRLNAILHFVDKHYDERLTLSDIAKQYHINYYYLSHFFKNISGVSFQEYLTRVRLNKSLQRLSDPQKTITEIAYEVGFPNAKAYTTAFKKKYGVQPSKYRDTIPANNVVSSPYAETMPCDIADGILSDNGAETLIRSILQIL